MCHEKAGINIRLTNSKDSAIFRDARFPTRSELVWFEEEYGITYPVELVVRVLGYTYNKSPLHVEVFKDIADVWCTTDGSSWVRL